MDSHVRPAHQLDSNCILLLNHKLILPKYNTDNSKFVGIKVRLIGKLN